MSWYRPRKFSFDPKSKKAYMCCENDEGTPDFTRFYHNGVVWKNKNVNGNLVTSETNDEITTISFLKSELLSSHNDDDDSSSQTNYEDAHSSTCINPDEMAAEYHSTSDFGPIFKLFRNED